MKEFDRLMLMNGLSLSELSLFSKTLSDNDDEPDLQNDQNKDKENKNERHQNLNHQRKFSITKMLLKLQKCKGMK